MAVGWSTATSATQLTSITTEQFFTSVPLAAPNEIVHVDVDINFPTTPTDNAVISVYGSLQGTADYDDIPFLTFIVDNGTDPSKVSFKVFGYYQFRVGVKRDGSTDTITSGDMDHRIGTMS